jgi:AmmeMemoRadiSam system protein A
MKQLDGSDQRLLLAIARRAIETAVCGARSSAAEIAAPGSVTLEEPAAAFVTLRESGELRGCVGLMRFEAPLWLNVRDAAISAALSDPRFLPVVERELPDLELEISVLDPPVELPDPGRFQAGRHGIIVERDHRRALLLPQVATEMGWNEEQMLSAVCRKANLPGDAWRDPSASLMVFESTCFSEAELAGTPTIS